MTDRAGAHPAAGGRWFEDIAAHAKTAYLRYSFTKGTEQEVGFLADVLALERGCRLLDVGCGPGRHARALGASGVEAVGLDIAAAFLGSAGPGRWVRGDARQLPFPNGCFDAAISLCQGGFGLLGGEGESQVLAEMARVVRTGGRVAVSAFSAYFALRHLEEGECFDASAGVNHERAVVRDEGGREATFDLWTTCFTPRELRLMAAGAGLVVDGLYAVAPGEYRRSVPDVDHPEWLLVCTRPPVRAAPGSV